MNPSLPQLIACAEREVALRKAVYPGLIRSRRLSEQKADHEIACMEGIITFLKASAPDPSKAAQPQPDLFASGT